MTKYEALVLIAQTLLRSRFNADELVQRGERPNYDHINRAVATAAQLIDPSDSDCQKARIELDRRYARSPFAEGLRMAGSGYAWE